MRSAFLPAYLEIVAPGARPERTAYVLHGILGSARNWRSFVGKRLAERLPGWRFVLVDLRHHGDSRGAPPPDTVAACALDVGRLAAALGAPPAAVIGHSFGGKVALACAGLPGSPWHGLASVWALDTPPGARSDGAAAVDGEVEAVLAAVAHVPQPLPDRSALDAALRGAGLAPGVVAWMSTNLRRATDAEGGDGYVWRFDLAGVRALIEDFGRLDLWSMLATRPPGQAPIVHLLEAGGGGRWDPEAQALLQAVARTGAVVAHRLPDAGHWVHVDAPDALADMLVADLASLGDGETCPVGDMVPR